MLLEKNKGELFHNLRVAKSFLTITQQPEAIEEKINKVDYKIFSKLSMAKKLKSKIKKCGKYLKLIS